VALVFLVTLVTMLKAAPAAFAWIPDAHAAARILPFIFTMPKSHFAHLLINTVYRVPRHIMSNWVFTFIYTLFVVHLPLR
jgi:hypothetical protein